MVEIGSLIPQRSAPDIDQLRGEGFRTHTTRSGHLTVTLGRIREDDYGHNVYREFRLPIQDRQLVTRGTPVIRAAEGGFYGCEDGYATVVCQKSGFPATPYRYKEFWQETTYHFSVTDCAIMIVATPSLEYPRQTDVSVVRYTARFDPDHAVLTGEVIYLGEGFLIPTNLNCYQAAIRAATARAWCSGPFVPHYAQNKKKDTVERCPNCPKS